MSAGTMRIMYWLTVAALGIVVAGSGISMVQSIGCRAHRRRKRSEALGLHSVDLGQDIHGRIGTWPKTQINIGAAVRVRPRSVGQQSHAAKRGDVGQGIAQGVTRIHDPSLARDVKTQFVHGR